MGTLKTDLGGYAFRIRRARWLYVCWECHGPIKPGTGYQDCGAGERHHVQCPPRVFLNMNLPHNRPHAYRDTTAGIPDTGIRMCAVCGDIRDSMLHYAWELASNDDLPKRFGRECDDYRAICSNGFDGPLALESAFLHNPREWPQCFPHGENGDASCTNVTVHRTLRSVLDEERARCDCVVKIGCPHSRGPLGID